MLIYGVCLGRVGVVRHLCCSPAPELVLLFPDEFAVVLVDIFPAENFLGSGFGLQYNLIARAGHVDGDPFAAQFPRQHIGCGNILFGRAFGAGFVAGDPSVALHLFATGLGLTPLLRAGTPDQHRRFLAPFLARTGTPLASKEVAVVRDIGLDDAREELGRVADEEHVGADGFWTLPGSDVYGG